MRGGGRPQLPGLAGRAEEGRAGDVGERSAAPPEASTSRRAAVWDVRPRADRGTTSGRRRAGPRDFPSGGRGQPLHTNFNLASGPRDAVCGRRSGGFLALTNRDGAPVGPVYDPYPAQLGDVSYGLMANSATAASALFKKPTPGAPNDITSAQAERVVFAPASSTFAAGTTRQVTLTTSSPTAVIRYTTTRARPIAAAGKLGNFTVDAATDVCKMVRHGLATGDMVRVSWPTPITTVPANYFVQVIDEDSFKLAIEPGGPPIDVATNGTYELRRDAWTGTAAATDIITTPAPHSFYTGDPVQVSTTGTLPGGLSAAATYYVVVTAANAFKLSSAATGTPIVDILDAGTGTLTVFRTPSPIYTAPIPVTVNTRIRAQAFETGRPDGPIGSEMYFALDAAAQAFTSNLPVAITHTWNTAMPNNNVPVDGYIMIFEPKAPDNLTHLTNPPDLISPCTLERHGSSTGGDPKFSMAVEMQDENGIDQNCSPFGMPADSDWLMHAPYYFDRSMMHNDLIYRISNDLGRYAMRTKLIEHIHNEQTQPDTVEGGVSNANVDYFGVYSFMEKVTRGSDRVDIENLTIADNALPNIAGGYMFKVDRLDPSETGIRPIAPQTFCGAGGDTLAWVNPREISNDPFKVVTAAQSMWFRRYLGDTCDALRSPTFTDPVNGYAKFIDVPAALDHHIINTATKNADAFRLSTHWHKPRGGKLVAGPIWDFDRAEGSLDNRDFDWSTWTTAGGTDFFTYPWYVQMFGDRNFWQAWIDRYAELRRGPFSTPLMNSHIDDFAAVLNPGNAAGTPAKRTVVRWPTQAPRTAASNSGITNMLFDGTYPGEVAWLKYWWQKRLEFMDGQFTRAAVASVPAGTVTPGTSVTLTSPSTSLPNVKIYYTTDTSDPRVSGSGAVSATAIPYSTPIVINARTRLFVRTYNPAPAVAPGVGTPVGSGWSAPTILDYSVQ